MFTLAHISDIHLQLGERPRLRELLGKRITGFANIALIRGARHQDESLHRLIAALGARSFDHLAVTGDLINLALAGEYRRAAKWLAGLGSPRDISMVPGNHDVYVACPPHLGPDLWARYMLGDDGKKAFPYLRRRGSAAIIGLSSALPRAPFLATGRLGAAQLARLGALLDETGLEGLCRIVLLHHPPLPVPTPRARRLVDAPALARVLARAGAELVLHGHNPQDSLCFTPGPNGPIPVVGVPSASSTGTDGHAPAQFNLYTLTGKGIGWRIAMAAHRLDPGSGRVEHVHEKLLRTGQDASGRA